MRINFTAFLFWAFLALTGFLIFGTFKAALVGLTIGLGLSLLATAFF